MQTRSLILQTQPTIDFRDSTFISLETLISGSPDASRTDILLSSWNISDLTAWKPSDADWKPDPTDTTYD